MKKGATMLIAAMLILGLIGVTGSATAAGYFDKRGEEAVPILVPLVISLIFTLAGVIGIYLFLRGTKIRTSTPKTIDFDFLKKYNTKKEREVDDEDREKVWEYTSIGLVQTGLSENARLTAKLTESGKRLLE